MMGMIAIACLLGVLEVSIVLWWLPVREMSLEVGGWVIALLLVAFDVFGFAAVKHMPQE